MKPLICPSKQRKQGLFQVNSSTLVSWEKHLFSGRQQGGWSVGIQIDRNLQVLLFHLNVQNRIPVNMFINPVKQCTF